MLSDLGCQCAANEGDLNGALQRAQDQDFDIAVLDIKLAGVSVSPVADALAARGIPFVFASGYCSGSIPPRICRPPASEETLPPRRLARGVAAGTRQGLRNALSCASDCGKPLRAA